MLGSDAGPLWYSVYYGQQAFSIFSAVRLQQGGFSVFPVKGTEGLIRPLVPGFQVNLMSRCLSEQKRGPIVNRSCLHRDLVRAFQIASGYQECFVHKACNSVQVGPAQILIRGLHVDIVVLLWLKVVEIAPTQNAAKLYPQLNVFASIADICSYSQATSGGDIRGRS